MKKQDQRAAKEVVEEHLFSTLVSALNALREGKVDNEYLRDIKMIHSNTSFSDLPVKVQNILRDNAFTLFKKLNKEGYNVSRDSN